MKKHMDCEAIFTQTYIFAAHFCVICFDSLSRSNKQIKEQNLPLICSNNYYKDIQIRNPYVLDALYGKLF